MTRTTRKVLYVFSGALFGGAIFLAYKFAPTFEVATGMLINATSAIATAAAAFIALHLGKDAATREAERERREVDREQQLGSVAAARIAGRAEQLSASIGAVNAGIVFCNAQLALFESLEQLVDRERLAFSSEELFHLAGLGTNVAHRLTHTTERIRELLVQVAAARDRHWSVLTAPSRDSLLQDWCRRVSECAEMMRVVSAELNRIATEAAPPPSSSELHGNDGDVDGD